MYHSRAVAVKVQAQLRGSRGVEILKSLLATWQKFLGGEPVRPQPTPTKEGNYPFLFGGVNSDSQADKSSQDHVDAAVRDGLLDDNCDHHAGRARVDRVEGRPRPHRRRHSGRAHAVINPDEDVQGRRAEGRPCNFPQEGDNGAGSDRTKSPSHEPTDSKTTPRLGSRDEAAANSDRKQGAAAEAPAQEQHESGTSSDAVLLEALASDLTYEQAGKAAGVSARTVARRMENPDFAKEVDTRRREIAEELINQIRRLRTDRIRSALDAHQVLLELLYDDDPKIRLAAARQLATSRTVQHDLDIQERLLTLEGRLEPLGRPRPPQGWAL